MKRGTADTIWREQAERGISESAWWSIGYETSPHMPQTITPTIASMIHANSLSPTDFARFFIARLLCEGRQVLSIGNSKVDAVVEDLNFRHFQYSDCQI